MDPALIRPFRYRTPARLAWLLAAALLSLHAFARPTAARSARSARSAKQPSARLLFFRGLRAFALGRYPDALALFVASYKRKPKSIVQYNIAMCHQALFQYTEAIAVFEAYVKERGRKLNVFKRRKIERLIATMRGKLGLLILVIHPPGARVQVDGQVMGTAPLTTPIGVNPGRRVVEVSHPGYHPQTERIDVTGGQRVTQTFRLKPLQRTGTLVLTCRAAGAMASVDGNPARPLPLTAELPVGTHRIQVTAVGFHQRLLTVQIRPRETTRHEMALVPLHAVVGSPPAVPPGTPTPIYRKWWFWTIVSAVVIAGGSTAGYFIWDAGRPTRGADLTWQLR